MSRQDTSSLYVGTTREYDNLAVPFATAGTILPVGSYEWQYATIGYNFDRTKRVYGSIGTDFGGYYNGDRQSVRASATLQVGKTLLFEPNYTHNRVTLADRPLYTSNVLNFRVSHSFSPDFYLKGFVRPTTIARRRVSTSCGGITTSPAATCMSSTTRAGISTCR